MVDLARPAIICTGPLRSLWRTVSRVWFWRKPRAVVSSRLDTLDRPMSAHDAETVRGMLRHTAGLVPIFGYGPVEAPTLRALLAYYPEVRVEVAIELSDDTPIRPVFVGPAKEATHG